MTRRRSLTELRRVTRNLIEVLAMSEERAAEWIQDIVAPAQVTDRAPDDVRAAIEVAVELHTYGTFSWLLFAVVQLQSRLTYELALGIRFMQTHPDGVPVEQKVRGIVDVIGSDVLEGTEFRTIRDRLGRRGSHRYVDGWRVVGHADFDGGLP